MKTIGISKTTRNMIEQYRGDDESINDAIGRLLKSSEPLQKIDRQRTNIKISEDNLDILKGFKSYSTESHSDTLMRLLLNQAPK